jgi:tetratricopeptide (TPR) repeat protein
VKNTRFTGRGSTIRALDKKIFGHDQSHRVALVGLGGVGKTQIALHFTYEVKKSHPECSVFWVPTLSDEGADQAFVGIAKELGLERRSKEGNVKELVCQYLSSKKAGKWLLIIDNADDRELILGTQDKPGLEASFPHSEHGHVLLTTRSRNVALEFTQSDIIHIEQMDQQEAINLFNSSLIKKGLPQNEKVTIELLARLAFLPLAITQAAAYLNQTGAPIRNYLSLLKGAESEVARVLGREFRDNTRYKGSRNAVGTTWIVSFEQMQKSNPVVINLLSFISCIEPKAIPQSLLPDTEPEEFEWAIGTLCSYSFMTRRGESDIFDMHSLVHTATRDWLEKQGRQSEVFYNSIRHIRSRLADRVDNLTRARSDYLSHAICLLDRETEKTPDTLSLFNMVGKVFIAKRRFREARRCFEEVCSWKTSFLPETNLSRLCAEHNLACSYLSSGRFEEAIKILCHIVKVQASIFAENHNHRLASEHVLGRAYIANGQLEDGIKILEYVVKTQGEIFAEDDRRRLVTKQALGTAYVQNRQAKDAIEILEHVVAVWHRTRNELSYAQLAAELSLAQAYYEDKRLEDSVTRYKTVVASWKETLDERDHSPLSAENMLGRAYPTNWRVKKAIEVSERVVAIVQDIHNERDYFRLVLEHNLSAAYSYDGRHMEANEILEHVTKVSSEILKEGSPFRRLSVYLLQTCYQALEHE